ncbi:MAG: oligosaccharide flippase family protein [Anaerolineae bacterium]
MFGVYAFASSIVALTRALPNFGLFGAFVHRAAETEGQQALRVHFTLITLFSAVWALVLAAGALAFAPADARHVYWVLIGTAFVSQLTMTPRALLTKRVAFKRLAGLQVVTAVATTVVSLGLAWYGFGVWSLLAANVVTVVIAVIALYGVRPVWRPRFGWNRSVAGYFLRFGSRVLGGALLLQALDRVDDLWTGAVLGNTALGFYSRAYRFATYPRSVLAKPLNSVAIGTYAQLKEDRKRLSQAFFRVNALLVRVNFLLAGLMVLVAPEFIRLVLGVKWMPMLDAFRLMLLYTLLDPIKITVANVITTSGAPEKVIRARLVQLAVMGVGLATLGPWLDIAGVALAVDLMLAAGMAVLFWQARAYVDFSPRRLFAVPATALAAGMAAARLSIGLPGVPGSDWRTGGVKVVVFAAVYAALLFALEREQLPMLLGMLRQLRPPKPAPGLEKIE